MAVLPGSVHAAQRVAASTKDMSAQAYTAGEFCPDEAGGTEKTIGEMPFKACEEFAGRNEMQM